MPQPDAAPRSASRDTLEALAVALLVSGVMLWPAAGAWAGIGGDALGETDNHLWMFWRALQGAGPVANAPDGISIPLMDPFNLLLYAPGAALSPVAGWWTLRLGNLLLAFGGGYLLARTAASHRAALVGGAALASAPFLAGMLDFGITESWPVGLFSIHLWCLVRYAGVGRARHAIGAGLSLGALALCGWYFAFFALLLEGMVVPVLLWRTRRWGLVGQGGLALAMVLPRFLSFREMTAQWDHRWYPPAPSAPPPLHEWRDLTMRGTDLLNLMLPHPEVIHPGKSSYLGVGVLVLVALAGARAPRKALPWVGLALPFLVLALGFWPRVAGHPIGIPGPPTLLVEWVPQMLGLSHWERALAGAVPALAVAAAIGADQLPRPGRAAWVLLPLLLVDSVAFSGASWPRAAVPFDAPGSLTDLAGAGGVVQLPFDNGREPFSQTPARLYNRWQVVHGRVVAENYEGPDALLATSRLIAAADGRCGLRNTLPPYYQVPPDMRDPEPPSGEALVEELNALRSAGFAFVVLHRARCPHAPRTIQLLEATLGRGEARDDGDWVWSIPEPTSARRP